MMSLEMIFRRFFTISMKRSKMSSFQVLTTVWKQKSLELTDLQTTVDWQAIRRAIYGPTARQLLEQIMDKRKYAVRKNTLPRKNIQPAFRCQRSFCLLSWPTAAILSWWSVSRAMMTRRTMVNVTLFLKLQPCQKIQCIEARQRAASPCITWCSEAKEVLSCAIGVCS